MLPNPVDLRSSAEFLREVAANPPTALPPGHALSQRADDRDVGKVRQNFVRRDSRRAYTPIRHEHNQVRFLRHWKQCESRHTMAVRWLSKLHTRCCPSWVMT